MESSRWRSGISEGSWGCGKGGQGRKEGGRRREGEGEGDQKRLLGEGMG